MTSIMPGLPERSPSWAFTATSTSTTLEFRSLTVLPQTGFGAAIDNVVVTPDPAATLSIRESEQEIQIEGHTDSVGTAQSNQVLSENRDSLTEGPASTAIATAIALSLPGAG